MMSTISYVVNATCEVAAQLRAAVNLQLQNLGVSMAKEAKKTAALLRWEAQQAAKKAGKQPAPTARVVPPSPTQRAQALSNTARGTAVTKLSPPPVGTTPRLAKLEAERNKRHPFANAGNAASTVIPAQGTSSSGKRETASARATTEHYVGQHVSTPAALAAGARHPRPWKITGGPDDSILSWIIRDAQNRPVFSMPFIYSNQNSLRAEAEFIVALVNKTKV
jgi:hypothetical protein